MLDKPNSNSLFVKTGGPAKDASDEQSHKSRLVCELEVKPRKQSRFMLGEYGESSIPLGYSIELNPDPDPEDSIVTQITKIETSSGYRLVLVVENFSVKTVKASVRVLS